MITHSKLTELIEEAMRPRAYILLEPDGLTYTCEMKWFGETVSFDATPFVRSNRFFDRRLDAQDVEVLENAIRELARKVADAK